MQNHCTEQGGTYKVYIWRRPEHSFRARDIGRQATNIGDISTNIYTNKIFFIQKDELCGRPFHLQSHLAALNVVYSAVGLFVVASDEAF